MSEIIKKALTDKGSRTGDTLRETGSSTGVARAPWS
jgi:hypothetical protein